VVPEVYWICTGSRGLDVRQGRGWIVAGVEGGGVLDVDDFADGGDLGGDGGGDLGHGVAAKFGHQEEADRARLFEHVFQLTRLVGGVGGDQGEAGQTRGIFDDHPFRRIGRPDADAFARAIAGEQRTARRCASSNNWA